MKNYYEILEVNRKASKEVIEKAYHVLVKKYHPDLYEGIKRQYAEKKLKEINEAYDILSDEFFKEQYDNELEKQDESRTQNNYTRQDQAKAKIQKKEQEPAKQHTTNCKPGSFGSMVELTKMVFHDFSENRKRQAGEFKKEPKKNAIAIALTIIVVIIIGIILWFIPFTNGWMRELLFENPLFNWIGSFIK